MTVVAGAEGLSKRFNGVVALDGFSFAVSKGEILGLMGPNGAGKTTLINVLTGLLVPDSGTAFIRRHDDAGVHPNRSGTLRVARTFQTPRLVRRLTLLENVLLWFADQPGERLFNVVCRPGLCRRWEAEIRESARKLLVDAGLADKVESPAGGLSYGQQKLAALVCCVAANAELVLLDEPVAGISPRTAEQSLAMIGALRSQGKAVIVIEHDVAVLMQIADRVIFMNAGQKICEGTPGEVLAEPRVLEAYLG